MCISLQESCTPKTISSENSLLFTITYNANSPIFHKMMDKSVECVKRNKVDGFQNLRVIKNKHQKPNLNKILTKAEFSQKQVGVFKCSGKRCQCFAGLLLGNSHTFKYADKTFNLKAHFACDISNLLMLSHARFNLTLRNGVWKNLPLIYHSVTLCSFLKEENFYSKNFPKL